MPVGFESFTVTGSGSVSPGSGIESEMTGNFTSAIQMSRRRKPFGPPAANRRYR